MLQPAALKTAAAHGLLSVAAMAWALVAFKPWHAGSAVPFAGPWWAELCFSVLSWPLVPVVQTLSGWQISTGAGLVGLVAVLAVNSLLWGGLLAQVWALAFKRHS